MIGFRTFGFGNWSDFASQKTSEVFRDFGSLRFRFHWPLGWMVVLVLIGSRASAQELYELTVDGRPDLTSQAQLEGARLTVKDSTGSVFAYDRHPDFDTPDGDLLGFRSLAAGASLRWPVTGSGHMWLGDLGGTMWRKSLQSANRLGGAGFAPGSPPVYGPGGIACLSTRGATAWSAHVGSDGKLRCYYGGAGAWKYRELPLGIPLIPGAPLAMYPTSGAWPGMLTVELSGRMISNR